MGNVLRQDPTNVAQASLELTVLPCQAIVLPPSAYGDSGHSSHSGVLPGSGSEPRDAEHELSVGPSRPLCLWGNGETKCKCWPTLKIRLVTLFLLLS